MKISIWILQVLGLLLFNFQTCLAHPFVTRDAVLERANKEECIPLPYIAIAFYKPNYILPFYYTGSPDTHVYSFHIPYNERIKNSEVKYQISLKVPVWKNIYDSRSSLYLAYTLLGYWQVYNKWPFIRENNYEPEFFLRNAVNFPLYKCWNVDFFNLGYSHQSNGWGNSLQRSWDRIYIEAITSIDNWMITLKPWYIIMAYGRNKNISDFLGYASFLVAYKFHNQVFSFQLTNLGVAPKRTTVNLTWSFPITPYIKGYAEIFSGYGQSLIEYNHHTNSAGIGIALSDWV